MSSIGPQRDRELARVVEKQMRNWEIARDQRIEVSAPKRAEVRDFVTIGNIVGAGGREVSALLAAELSWPIFGRQILTAMAGDDQVRARIYKSMDERDLGWFENIFRSVTESDCRKNDYYHRLTETILCLARQGSAVFVGRSADLILPKSKGLRVKLVASLSHCFQGFAQTNKISLDQARGRVEHIESERGQFVRNHFHIDPHDPTRYDLLINVEHFSTRQVVDLILLAMKMRGIEV